MRKERFLSLGSLPLHYWWGASEDGTAASLQSGQTCILHGWSMPATCVPQTETHVYLVLKLRLQTSGPGKGLGLAAQSQLEGAGGVVGAPEGISGGAWARHRGGHWPLHLHSNLQGDNGRHILKKRRQASILETAHTKNIKTHTGYN